MNRQEEIQFLQKTVKTVGILKEVIRQLDNTATQLESEAKRALEVLGNVPKRTSRGSALSQEKKLELRASITKIHKNHVKHT